MGKPTEIAGKVAGKMQGIAKRLEGYKGIFRKLAEEHAEVSVLMRRVLSSSEVAEVRRELFPKIRRELLSHARAEEQEFYSVLERYPETRDFVEHSGTDHRRIEILLDQLSVSDPAQPAWTETFRTLVQAVDDHVDDEEKRLFPLAKDLLPEVDVIAMEERFAAAKKSILARVG
jgi:hemerythrin superfamily protein